MAASRNPREIETRQVFGDGGTSVPYALPHNQVRYQTPGLLDMNIEYFMNCAGNLASLKMSLAQPPNVRALQYHIATSNRILTIRCQGA
jgi:hypothetical protein